VNNETSGRVAAFFDLDGTLIARPSLERRFFAELRCRRAIPVGNYFLWLAQAAWLAPRGIQMMRNANKMYLRGVRTRNNGFPSDGGQLPGKTSEQGRMTVPRFFQDGVDQVAWHAQQGHSIVLVSGTLAPLAQQMAFVLVVRLAVRGIAASVAVCATRLEENDGRWTGRIVGDAMFGEAKARAVRELARKKGLSLAHCYAYGDCINDRSMLEAVGRPSVVNPSGGMERLAGQRGWRVLAWAEKGNLTQRAQRTQPRDEALLRPRKLA
jgi:HAD superfamily hydrolase (TIGR01490 family)